MSYNSNLVVSDDNMFSKNRVMGAFKSIEQHSFALRHISGEEWDKVMPSLDGACQEQLYVFSKNRWPNVSCEPVLFYNASEEIIGGAMVLVQPLPLKLSSIAILKWGPLLKNSSDKNTHKNYTLCIETLLEEYDKKRKMMVSILPRAVFNAENDEYNYLAERGFRQGSQLKFPNRYIVNLRLSDEEQLKSFAQKWRYHLNKSKKADLSFEHVAPEKFADFDLLYQQMNERKKFTDHSAYEDTIKVLMEIRDDNLRPEMFFVKQNEEIVAGAIIFKTGETAVYLYGATNENALGLRAGYFLHWHIIRWLRDNTPAKYYDLGGTDGFQGLHQFKKGMVGASGMISPVPPVANYASNIKAFLFGHLAFIARDSVIKIKHAISGMRSDIAQPNQKVKAK